jgi:hypothetical protein
MAAQLRQATLVKTPKYDYKIIITDEQLQGTLTQGEGFVVVQLTSLYQLV